MGIQQILFIVLTIIGYSCNDYYNDQLGQQFLMYSKITYCPQQNIESWTCESCLQSIKMKDITVITNSQFKSQAFVGYDESENRIVIAFRGSDNVKNFIDDINLEKSRYPFCNDCKVHTGFYNVWHSLQKEIFSNFEALRNKYPLAKLVITGHSLGGALATFAASELAYKKVNIQHVIVFGAPRVGNKQFTYWSSKLLPQYVVVIHHKDPAPHLPQQIFGFRRLPTEVWYKNAQGLEWEWCPSKAPYENKKCSDQFKSFLNLSEHLYYLDQYTGCGDEYQIEQLENSEYQNLEIII